MQNSKRQQYFYEKSNIFLERIDGAVMMMLENLFVCSK
jgi:hypothetical protein